LKRGGSSGKYSRAARDYAARRRGGKGKLRAAITPPAKSKFISKKSLKKGLIVEPDSLILGFINFEYFAVSQTHDSPTQALFKIQTRITSGHDSQLF
jgi:hypothetical protein